MLHSHGEVLIGEDATDSTLGITKPGAAKATCLLQQPGKQCEEGYRKRGRDKMGDGGGGGGEVC